MPGEPTFTPPRSPSFPMEENRAPRVLKADFGDGYAERVGDGLNADQSKMPLQWENLTTVEANAVLDFMAGRKGYLAFVYAPPGFGAAKKWIAPTFSRTRTEVDSWTVRVELEQVFDA